MAIPGFKIENFYDEALRQDFSRKYQMRVVNIAGILGPQDNIFITTANLPDYEIHNIQTPFMGMQFNIPGSGHYPGSANWQVVFRCDLNFKIHDVISSWQRSIFTTFADDGYGQSAGSTGRYHIPGKGTSAWLQLHNREGAAYKQYRLFGIYPKTVGQLTYNQTDNGTIQELQVTLAYQYWRLDASSA